METIFIFYVANQQKSRDFYQYVFQQQPVLDEEGMTEFIINENSRLGLMPEEGIVKLLENKIPHPSSANGIPRSEMYIYVDDPEEFYHRALQFGAMALSPLQRRNWGDSVAYCSDPDGHTLAFAKTNSIYEF
ncbi:MAG: VOC family protein [Bacteroidetes bacterium]|nr:VOC family protein [Bacteroidota bacterium]